MDIKTEEKFLDGLMKLTETDARELVKRVMRVGSYAVATPHSCYTEDELLCDPIIWTGDDLEEVAIHTWRESRANVKLLHDRSIEEGHQIRDDIESMIIQDLKEMEVRDDD